jgi:hypothetical protein
VIVCTITVLGGGLGAQFVCAPRVSFPGHNLNRCARPLQHHQE